MNTYIYEYDNFEFAMRIPLYWEQIYKGKPREKLYHNYQQFLNLLKRKVSKERYVLDIGVNHGIFSTPAAMLGYRLLGFEPVQANFDSAVENMALNNCKHFSLFNLALSDKNEELNIYVPECPDNASFSAEAAVANMKNKTFETEKVQAVRFDDWITENPQYSDIGFIKCDTQGAEFSIIDGAKEFLKQSRNVYLIVEFEEHLFKLGHTYDELENLILSLGFIRQGNITGGDRLYFKR